MTGQRGRAAARQASSPRERGAFARRRWRRGGRGSIGTGCARWIRGARLARESSCREGHGGLPVGDGVQLADDCGQVHVAGERLALREENVRSGRAEGRAKSAARLADVRGRGSVPHKRLGMVAPRRRDLSLVRGRGRRKNRNRETENLTQSAGGGLVGAKEELIP